MLKLKLRLYKVLRRVGLPKGQIVIAENKDELFLDELDNKLLTFYFEDEFKVNVADNEIPKLRTLTCVYNFLGRVAS